MSVRQRRAELLEQLIGATTGLAPGHPARAAVTHFCEDKFQFHSFLDTHPPTVDEELAQLRARLEAHAQFDKSEALGALAERLSPLDADSAQRDFPHRVLSFLVSSAHRVLQTSLEPALLAGPGGEAEPAAQEALPPWSDEDEDGSDAEWWGAELAYSPDDALSAWSGEEEDDPDTAAGEGGAGGGGTAPGSPSAGKPPGPHPLDAPLTPVAPPRHATRSPSRLHRGAASPWRRQLPSKPYGATSLSVWLAAKDSGGHPARQLDPRRCFTETELVLQVRKKEVHVCTASFHTPSISMF